MISSFLKTSSSGSPILSSSAGKCFEIESNPNISGVTTAAALQGQGFVHTESSTVNMVSDLVMEPCFRCYPEF